MTYKQVFSAIRKLSTRYGVKTIIYNYRRDKLEAKGKSNNRSGIVFIFLKHQPSVNSILSTWFHELGHVHCGRNGLWKSYHRPETWAEKDKLNFKRTMLRAELWVDEWGKQEMKKYFPTIAYKGMTRNKMELKSKLNIAYKQYLK